MEMYLQHNVTGVRNKPCVCTAHTDVVSHFQSLIAGVKQQFNSILSQVENEVMAEWHLFEEEK